MASLDAVGRTVCESDFRNRYGVQIVAIEHADGTMQCPADPNTRLKANHRLWFSCPTVREVPRVRNVRLL